MPILRRALATVPVLALLAGPSATATEPSAEAHPLPTEPAVPIRRVTLNVVGFSEANAAVIRATLPELERQVAYFNAPLTITVELDSGSNLTGVTIDERMSGEVNGVGLVPFSMGFKALNFVRPQLLAGAVNAWIAVGPVREAFAANNMPLVTALGRRAFVVRYDNLRGDVLSLAFDPGGEGNVYFGGLVIIQNRAGAVAVEVDPRTGVVALPVGADGRPTPSAWLYGFFGVKP